MKVKTSELIGPALDWAVAVADGYSEWDGEAFFRYNGVYCACFLAEWKPSTNREQGGLIMEEERICLTNYLDGDKEWAAYPTHDVDDVFSGPTPLIAGMRCYVASKLGDEVDIPEGLR